MSGRGSAQDPSRKIMTHCTFDVCGVIEKEPRVNGQD
jgi:hypothetical protein